MDALSSNEFVKTVEIGKITTSRDEIANKLARITRRSDSENSNFTDIDFTAKCVLFSNATSVDVEPLITESFAKFLNTTVELKIEGVIYIAEGYRKKIQNHLNKINDPNLFHLPSEEEIYRIMTDDNKTYCKGDNQWTSWYSHDDATNGNDFEILADHVDYNKLV